VLLWTAGYWLWRWWFSLRKSQDSLPIIFQVPRGEEENLAIGVLAVILIFLAYTLGWIFHAAWSRTSRYAQNREISRAFEESFDKSTEGPRLVLLLSPT